MVAATFTHHANLIGIPLAWLAGVPRRVASHHGQIEGLPNWMQWLHTQVINRGIASVLVAVSERVRRQAIFKEGVRPELIVVIPNGIRAIQTFSKNSPEVNGLRAELGFQPSDHIFLTVGRLVTQKGHSFLLDAIPEVVAAFPAARFVFVGDGPLRPELEDRVAALRIQDLVRFLGIRDDIPLLLSTADGFILPSLWEGLPIALLEAMSAGLPVIATDVEGVDEVIQNGENGLLVPPADPTALAAAILHMLSDPNLCNQFALDGQELIAEKYAIDKMGANYEKLYLQGTIIA
jgi:glycosyltransferase involved in cell wall biosynthesis